MRFVFRLLIVLPALPAASEVASATAAEAPRWNILFCFADDWGRYAGAYHAVDRTPSPNQVLKTPNIDRVAADGVLFRNAFVNSPSCTPCRSALNSGRYFFNTGRGAILLGAQWDPAIPSFGLRLHDAGYHIGETWKVWSPGTPGDAPFGGGKFAYESAGGAFNNFSENATRLTAEGLPLEQARDKLLADVRGNFDAFLAARPGDKPFLYWFGPTTVHRSWVKGSGRALWNIDPEALAGKLPKFLPDVPEVREDFADYLGEIQAWDAAIGVLLQRLQEAGEAERTLVVISGDHGAPGFPRGKCNLYDFGVGVALVARVPGGKPGRVVDDFVNLMDLAPTFIEVGGAKLPDKLDGRSLLDVLRSDRSGQVDPQRTWVVTGRERHVDSARDDNLPYPQRALRTNDFLYIRNFKPDRWPLGSPKGVTDASAPSAAELERQTFTAFADMDASPTKAWLVTHRAESQWRTYYDFAFAKRPGEELYDLRTDPQQLTNVAEEARYAEVRREMSDRLLKVLHDAGDPRVVGDGETFERPPFTDVERRTRPAGAPRRRRGD